MVRIFMRATSPCPVAHQRQKSGDSPPFVKRWKPVSYGLPSLASILAESPENRSGSRGHRIDHSSEGSPSEREALWWSNA